MKREKMKKTALELIAEERQRQIDVYGYTDDFALSAHEYYSEGELADAAACYAMSACYRQLDNSFVGTPAQWPWHASLWRPSPENRILELTKAAAMLVAEIDRLQNL